MNKKKRSELPEIRQNFGAPSFFWLAQGARAAHFTCQKRKTIKAAAAF
jgi:hypothetical protein